VKVQHNWHLIT